MQLNPWETLCSHQLWASYADVLEVSFTLFPWSETPWSVLAVPSGPPGNTRVACVPLAGTLKVTVGEQAAGAAPWGLSEFQPPQHV